MYAEERSLKEVILFKNFKVIDSLSLSLSLFMSKILSLTDFHDSKWGICIWP